VNLVLLRSDEINAPGSEGLVSLSGLRAEHLLNVLRVVPGHQVRVGILDGPYGIGIVESIDGRTVELRCTFERKIPPSPPVDLLLALPRPKVLRRLWAQLAALGVGQIILTNAERVERNYFDAHVLKPECYEPLLIEGLQQARDTRLPRVSIHRQFRILIEDELDGLFPSGFRLVADPATEKSPAQAVQRTEEERVLVAVGPEGGWNAFEMQLFKAHRFQPAGLGRRTLRTDTASVALLAVVHDVLKSRAGGCSMSP